MQYRVVGRTLVIDGAGGGGRVVVPLPDAHWQVSYRGRFALGGMWVVIDAPGARQELKSTAAEVAAMRSAMAYAYLDDPLEVACEAPGFLRKKPARLTLAREGCGAVVGGQPKAVSWDAFAQATVGKHAVAVPGVGSLSFAPDQRTRFWLEAYKDYAAARSQAAAAAANAQAAQAPAPQLIEVQNADGSLMQVKAEELKAKVMRAEVGRETPCRIVAAPGAKQTEWAPLDKLARKLPGLDVLYRPIRHYALQGLAIGAAVGYVLKALDSVAGFLMVDHPQAQGIGLMLGAVLALPFNPFIAMLAVMLVGFLTIGPVGAFIGGLVGWHKARRGRAAPDARPESGATYFMAFGLPGVFLAAWVPTYVWLNYKMIEWLAK